MSREDLWSLFRESSGLDHDTYDVVAFGDTPAMATELAALVVGGRKRATASLLRDYGERTKVPGRGDCFVVVDGEDRPCCICQTSAVRIGPFTSVDEAFAYDEGEGDRSLTFWLEAHRAFFERRAAVEGFIMYDGIETVFERFAVVWPPEISDTDRR